MTITADFYKAFDPSNERHVRWLARMFKVSEEMKDLSKQITLLAEINMNPLKIELSHGEALEWPNIHFILCMKYTKAVFSKTAFIPA